MKNKNMGDVDLLCKEIEIHRKRFSIMFKENPQTQFMVLSSINRHTHFSVLIPSSAVSGFLESLDCCIASSQRLGFCKELMVDDKLYRFVIGENLWGRFLKVSETSSSSTRAANYIYIPTGTNQKQNGGLVLLRKAISEIDENAKLLFPPHPGMTALPSKNSTEELNKAIYGLNIDLNAQNLLKVTQNESKSRDVFQTMKTGQNALCFDHCGAKSGPYLRIFEEARRNCYIRIPMADLRQFHGMIGQFLETPAAKEKLLTAANGDQSISTSSGELSHDN